jgi:hypothetical protein
VIADVAVLAPSCVVTVIVADPDATAVTRPDPFTVATAVLFELQLTVLFVAFDGDTVAVSCCVPPTFRLAVVGDTLTPVTATVPTLTVIADVAVLLPSCVVTVIVAVPCATPLTNPLALTVATEVLLELQLTVLFVAFDGDTVAVNCVVEPTFTDAVVGDTLTPVTATVPTLTVIADVAVLLPSCVVTVIVAVPCATPLTNPLALTVATAVLLELQLRF